VEAARQRIPGLAITTDIMVGFPGETDEDFAESLRYVEQTGFARLHVFPYSPREGTAAARMPDQTPSAVMKARKAAMLALSDRLWEGFVAQHIGRVTDVLWESARGAGPDGWVWSGLAGDYLRVTTTARADLRNTITPTRVTGVQAGEALGVVVAWRS
jgi:threonylcarbamoyladenosine tRNA methylthiotransferase MtaB